ncbi:ogr/Delta-like zinc finger family protein [Salmonella enterica]|nr:transcriptional regulator [Salmonella enterica]EEJ8659125.1 ogr/Delta-like zinc finger family protein [Salmonella enterica subsp. enterica]EAW8898340.1 transcriptional regulator [Salmonella enterica]EAZ1322971.1 transcriptional regulator [Salmonella enterica]EBF0339512.1 transcriptional regulator [Salmonella enterica]
MSCRRRRYMSRAQKRKCRYCGCAAIIERTEWKTESKTDVANLYVRCTNLECGHTWVENVTYSHTLVPSALKDGVVRLLLDNLKPEERQLALDLLMRDGA